MEFSENKSPIFYNIGIFENSLLFCKNENFRKKTNFCIIWNFRKETTLASQVWEGSGASVGFSRIL